MRFLVFVSLVVATLTVVTTSAGAVTVNGRVVNGTTGDESVNATVIVVNPAGGMVKEQTVEAKDGRFTATLDARAPIYLIRVDYAGVMYTSTVNPAQGDPIDVTVTVYETTTSWEGVTVSIPHVAATRHGDHLSIEKLYEIENATDPPRSLGGTEGMFHFSLPMDLQSINSAYVSALGMPIERQPTKTDVPGEYRMDYPIRPGLTRIGISFTVPYANGTYTLVEDLRYGLRELTVFGVDPEMLITARGAEFVTREAADNITSYTASSLARDANVEIIFSGGANQSGDDVLAGGTSGTVTVVASNSDSISLVVMLSVLLVLTVLIGISASTPDPLRQPKRVRAYYEVLVRKLARLDDMARTEVITDEVYRAKREELKGQLTSLAQRFRDTSADVPREPDISPASTKEQTNS